MQHKVESQHIRHLKTLDFTGNDALKMRTHTLRRDFPYQQVIGSAVRSEERDIGLVPFVARTSMYKMYQLGLHKPASSTLTRTYSSIIERGASVGQIPSRPRGSVIPPAPPINGGPLNPNGVSNLPNFAASRLSAQRIAIRR